MACVPRTALLFRCFVQSVKPLSVYIERYSHWIRSDSYSGEGGRDEAGRIKLGTVNVRGVFICHLFQAKK